MLYEKESARAETEKPLIETGVTCNDMEGSRDIWKKSRGEGAICSGSQNFKR